MGISAAGRIRRFAGVLRYGRRMMSSSSGVSPWLMLRPHAKSGGGKRVYRFYSLEDKEKRIFEQVGGELESKSNRIVGSSHGWLASFDQSNRSLFLTEPVLGRQIELPSVATIPDSDDWVSRVIISASPDDGQECRALMLYGGNQEPAFCVPRRSDKWSPIIHEDEVEKEVRRRRLWNGNDVRSWWKYENFVYSNRRKTFFCIKQISRERIWSGSVQKTTELEGWDLRDPDSPRRMRWGDFDSLLDFDSKKYPWPAPTADESSFKTWESSDQLLVVVRHVIPRLRPDGSFRPGIWYNDRLLWDCSYPHKTVAFDVFKIDLEQKLVSHMDYASLDGLALFVGINQPFAVRSGPASQLQPDSIYFTDLPDHISWYYSGHDNGVFNYENRTFSPCHSSYPIINPSSIKLRRRRRSVAEILSAPLPLWYTPNPNPNVGDERRCLS